MTPPDISEYGFERGEVRRAMSPRALLKFTRFWNKKVCAECKQKVYAAVIVGKKPFDKEMLCDACKVRAEAFR